MAFLVMIDSLQNSFVHLRVHTAYSLSEGAVRIKDLAKQCRAAGMPAVAITDTNNLFGALEFSLAAADAGVQPIIGCQLAIWTDEAADNHPMVFLAQDDAGYRNLLKLVAKAFMESEDPTAPSVTLEAVEAHAESVIALTGGPGGPVGSLLYHGQTEAAEALTKRLHAAFADRLYIEIQRHGTPAQRKTEPGFLKLAYDLNIPLVATNEVFFPTEDMFEAHDALVCIAERVLVEDQNRRRLTREHWLKDAAAMRRTFKDLPEAIDNTLVIAQRCAFMVDRVDPILPPFPDADGKTEEDALRELAAAGLDVRITEAVYTDGMDADAQAAAATPYRERLDYELGVINQMGFPGYFLIVADFIKWAKDQDIPVGPGRGSGAGSVVAWALTITDLDPLRFGLLFERFLNPERVSMPDFDIDFCQDRRDEVIRYVQDRYGHDRVAQIITFGKLQARAVLRDVGRVLGMPYGQIDRISKMIPNNPANPCTLPEAIEQEPQLQDMIRNDREVAHLIDLAKRLEGLYRHASTHAAGVVIGDRPLDELIPLYRDPGSTMPVTGFNMKFVEQAGLVKFDFLGLKTLTVLATAERFVHEGGGNVDVSKLPLDDRKTFEMIAKADTTGVFQLESAGMRDVLRTMKPDTFEDIIAVVALYRPGPMDNIPSYIKRKHGEEEPDYLYPILEPVLKETFGIPVYQEQVMQIAQELSGYSLGGADLLRRAMGKKIQAEMDQQRAVFVDGAIGKGVPKTKAGEVFDIVAKFAGYGFNKSHAAAYALVAYQTAYMKANHPVEFLAASMVFDQGNTDKLNVFRQELDRLKISLRPPDLNKSQVTFSVERTPGEPDAIRYALAAIKNVGDGAMAVLVKDREENGPFETLGDVFNRLDSRALSKRALENLACAGAFDYLDPNRRQVFDSLDVLIRHASAQAIDRASDQIGLFGGADEGPPPLPKLATGPDWGPMDRIRHEFDAVGFYLSAHPLDAYTKTLETMRVKPITKVLEDRKDGYVKLAGTVISKKERISAKGNRFAFVQFSDPTGVFEITLFSELLAQHRENLEAGQSLLIGAGVTFEGDNPRFTAQTMEMLDEGALRAAITLQVVLDGPEAVGPLHEILSREGQGRGRVKLIARTDDDSEITLDLGEHFKVSPEIMLAVKSLRGVAEVLEL